MSTGDTIKDGYRRVVYDDCVNWYTHPYTPDDHGEIPYCVSRFPFVPEYHLCVFVKSLFEPLSEYPMQQFTTLSQALAVLRVLDASTIRNSSD